MKMCICMSIIRIPCACALRAVRVVVRRLRFLVRLLQKSLYDNTQGLYFVFSSEVRCSLLFIRTSKIEVPIAIAKMLNAII